YDVLIAAFKSGAITTAAIKTTASAILSDPSAMMLVSLLTSDRIVEEDNVSASGCMISITVMDADLDIIHDGQKGFENDIISTAKSFVPATGLNIRVAGMVTMMNDIGSLAQKDIAMLLPIAIIVIALLLLLIYRDLRDTLVGLLGLLIAVVWTFGIAILAGIEMSTIAIAVPILIIALGIDYSLHLVFRYREERRSGYDPKGAISRTMGSVGEALVLATVTTAIAFLSYLTSAMSALADFGVMCAIGIVCAFGVMLLLVPPLQVRRDRKAEKNGNDPDEAKRYKNTKSENGDVLGKISGIGGRMAAKSPWAVLGAVALVIVLSGYSATNLSYDFNMYEFIPEGTDAHDTITYLNDNYSTTTITTSVLIYEDGWDLKTIKAIEGSLTNMAKDPITGLLYQGAGPPSTEYIGTALSQFNNDYGAQIIPGTEGKTYSDLYSQVFDANGILLPAATQTGLNFLKNITPQAAVSSVVGNHDGKQITRMILHMTPDIQGNNDGIIEMKDSIDRACQPLALIGADHTTTGQSIIMAVSMKEMNNSQMTSLLVTIAFVLLVLTLFMFYIDRSWILGALATVPTLISVIMVWGTMALIGMPLNVMTLTIASLAVGMGVTYGIHISHRYVTELVKNDRDAKDAIKVATRETGKGVFAAAVTTVAGFGVLGFSKILPMYQFGIITALAIGFGYIGSIFVLPSLLVIWGKYAKPRMMAKRNGTKKGPKDPEPENNTNSN
ncbi:MAG: MMPL family transporter, partial [Methanomassiliicoccaceae archaeon]|nr:MMPL family transporter [Methanomassiliicoccaceae archaeon]